MKTAEYRVTFQFHPRTGHTVKVVRSRDQKEMALAYGDGTAEAFLDLFRVVDDVIADSDTREESEPLLTSGSVLV